MTGSDLVAALAQVTGDPPQRVSAIRGGDICDAYRAELADSTVFVKTRPGAPAGFFRSEALGLEWLAAARAVRVPDVVAATDEMLVLEWVSHGAPSTAAAAALGRDLAALHRSGAESFGAPWRGFIGSLPQDNGPYDTWPELFAQARVLPFVREAVARGALDVEAAITIERVVDRLDAVGGPTEPPSRLHGDLWAGNVLWTAEGAVLVDPAAHGGHRETDLAMLALFGAPHLDTLVSSYAETFPLAEGWRERIALHQLPPLLAHAVMFGGAYGQRAASVALSYL